MRQVKASGTPSVSKGGGGGGGVGIPGTGPNSEVHNSTTASYAAGTFSFSSGYHCQAQGAYSFAAGSLTYAGDYAFAANVNNKANGNFSATFGNNNIAHFGQFIIGQSALNDTDVPDATPLAGQKVFKIGAGSVLADATNTQRVDLFWIDDAGKSTGMGKTISPNHSDTTTPLLRVAIIGDSIASNGSQGGFLEWALMQSKGYFGRVVNAGIGGNTLVDMDARFLTDIPQYKPDICFISGGSNDGTLTLAVKTAFISLIKKCLNISCRPIVILPALKTGFTGAIAVMGNWMASYCESVGVEYIVPWDNLLTQNTGVLNPAALDGLGVHPLHSYAWGAGSVIADQRVIPAKRRAAMHLATNGTTGQNSWVIDPFNTTGTGTQGSRISGSTSAGGTVTFTKTDMVDPDKGKWQDWAFTLPTTAGANGDAAVAAPGGMAIPSGDFLIRYRFKITECTNASIDAYMNFNNDSGVDVGGGRKSYHSAIQGLVDGTISYILPVPAGAYRPEIKFKITKVVSGSAASCTISGGMWELRTLNPA